MVRKNSACRIKGREKDHAGGRTPGPNNREQEVEFTVKISILQMNMLLGAPRKNFQHAGEMIRRAAQEKPDVILLPETWNTGFFPRDNLELLCDHDCGEVKALCGLLAAELGVHIAAGSVSNLREGRVYNTAAVFDRAGKCIAQYDKLHLFSPMQEQKFYTPGDHITLFELDGIKCGIILCYDLRFPELTRRLTLAGAQVLFIPAQWPDVRRDHWQTLIRARAMENQIFIAACNSCGRAQGTRYGGSSCLCDPWGRIIAGAGEEEQILTGELALSVLTEARQAIPVLDDRRPELYRQ